MKRSLITYSTVDGQTKIISEKIAAFASHSETDVLPISDQINLDNYETIIIGASIRYGKYRKEVYSFIEDNIQTLKMKENAFFSVNVVARKPEKSTPDTNPYLKKFLSNIKWVPKNLGVFAGKIEYPKYKFIDKYAIKFIMWITKGPTDTSKTYEFTNWKAVEDFARDLEL
ncbi:MAG: menaquinone-dependent protoporphyrinogen IX dehydrogenase [Gammaproteobacteria bacterium]|jgi:menaquinone-dependent protoporphyrinogen oxidase|tara:strand:- start:3745 stop:4257 length:513 start_codon:yes stop_codon:yes gene_type:complete